MEGVRFGCQKSADVFKQGMVRSLVHFPLIAFVGQWYKPDPRRPLAGLSLCFSRETETSFYLCHICEEKHPLKKILFHLSSVDHCANYFSYKNPNVLNFSWIPTKKVDKMLRPPNRQEVKESSGGQLEMLDLPGNLFKQLETNTYHEVMHTLGENENLLNCLKAVKPKRATIQTYQRDTNREHPLLGTQHLVEIICVGQPERKRYLCTLCHLTLTAHAIIKHVLSFDHIFCYFRVWHPSTLLAKESYKEYSFVFASMMLDFAKQTEEIHATTNTDVKQVNLEAGKFTTMRLTCYADALKELESMRKKNLASSLVTSIKPGDKLVHFPTTVFGGLRYKDPRQPVNQLDSGCYKLRCQNCSMGFENMSVYCTHLANYKHKQMLKKFGGVGCSDKPAWKPSLGLYDKVLKNLKDNPPLVGVSLVVACVCSEVHTEPLYVCFACQDCFTESALGQHFDSQKHLVHTLLYQDPWRLPLAWENRVDLKALRSIAWEEEKNKPDKMMLKVLDMPNSMFDRLAAISYPKLMKCLELQHIILKRDVPPCETYSKLKENDRFPLLGRQFLVMHNICIQGQPPTKGFLCMLCQRRLSDEEFYAHEFSRRHIAMFIERFHPGSLDSNSDEDTFLDLAKQATRYHPISHVQVIQLSQPVGETCTYSEALSILTSANRRNGKSNLNPNINPKMKLAPRPKRKDVQGDHVRKGCQKNCCLKEEYLETSPKSADIRATTLKPTVGVCTEVTDSFCPKSGEKGDCKESVASSGKELLRIEAFSGASSDEVKEIETYPAIKEENIERPKTKEPSVEAIENRPKTDLNDKEPSERNKCVLMQKRKILQMDTCPYDDEEQKPSDKRQRLTTKTEPSCEADLQQAAHLWPYVKRKIREPVIGLSSLIECNCDERAPIYLCECCSLKIPEKDIISHVTGADHQRMYLKTAPGTLHGKTIRHSAALSEQEHGYGCAEVVELDHQTYDKLFKQDFDSSIQDLKAFKGQLDICPSTLALSSIQPVGTSVPLKAQHQVLEINEESPESSMSNTTKAPPESHDAQIKVSNSPCHWPNTFSSRSEGEAEIVSNTTVGLYKISTAHEEVWRSSTTPISTLTTKSSNSTQDATSSKTESTAAHKAACRTVAAVTTAEAAFSFENRPSASSLTVGLNQLIKVSCGQKKQVYCRLCSVRLLTSEHMCSITHQFNYVKMKFPQWSCKPSELQSEFRNKVAQLAEDEGERGSIPFPRLLVTIDVYKELADLPAKKALERLKATLGRVSAVTSPATANPVPVLRLEFPGASRSEALCPVDDIESCLKEGSFVMGRFIRAPSLESSEPEADDQILDKLHSILSKNESTANPLQDVAEAKNVNPHTPVARKETPEWRQQQHQHQQQQQQQQQERSRPETRGTRMVLEGFQKTSPVNPVVLPKILIGECSEGSSHLSSYLKVMRNDKPVVGMGSVWECRFVLEVHGLCRNPLFLCESCSVMLSHKEICQHMVSTDHRINYIMSQHPDLLYFWPEDYSDIKYPDITLEKWMKSDVLNCIAQMLSDRERCLKTDAQSILLGLKLYERVRTASFSEALQMLKNIKRNHKLSVCCSSICIAQRKDQPPGDQHSPEESLPMGTQPAQTFETRSDNEPIVRDNLEGVKQSGVLNHLDVTASSRDRSILIKKRAAVESIDSLVRSSTDNPNLTDPLPAKCKLQPIIEPRPESVSQSASVNPAATSNPLSRQDKDARTVSYEQDVPVVDQATFDHIMALFRERQSEVNVFSCTSRVNSASESGVQKRLSQNSANQKICGLESVTGTKNPAPVNTLEEKPSLDGSALTRGEVVSVAAPAKPVGTMSPLASPADLSCPQVQTSVNARTTFGSTGRSICSAIDCAGVSSVPGHTAQPQDKRTGADQLPINAIVSVRSEQPGHQVIGGIIKEDFTKLNWGNQITPCLSSTDSSGRCGPYSQMAFVADRPLGYLSSGAVGSSTTPGYRPVHTGSSFQCEGYPAGGLYFPSRIHPEQETTCQSLPPFGNCLATRLPPQWVRLGMQQQQFMRQQPSTSLAASNEAAYAGATSFTNPGNISQKPFSD
ncbi:uncharacterized protein AB9W97_000965 isoform 2-T2 [Spinachia spinachia]